MAVGICKPNVYFDRTGKDAKTNAQIVANYFKSRGWTKNAISGMLGNMQSESTMNPCLWENFNTGDKWSGYGLVQWTPSTDFINWANSNNLDIGSVEVQCKRIDGEMRNNNPIKYEFIPTTKFPITADEYKKSTKSIAWLTECFVRNYERPAEWAIRLEQRIDNALYWARTLDWSGTGSKFCERGTFFYYPFMQKYPVSSEFDDPNRPFHYGTDLAVPRGVPIMAGGRGEVYERGILHKDYGNYVRIKYGDGFTIHYFHMLNPPPVSVGQKVEPDTVIGHVGSTGDSTGYHLHYEVRVNGEPKNPRNYTDLDNPIFIGSNRICDWNWIGDGGGGGGIPEPSIRRYSLKAKYIKNLH